MNKSLQYATWLILALSSAATSGCSDGNDRAQRSDPARGTGIVNLALTGGDGIVIDRVDYVVKDAAGQTVLTDHIDTTDPQATFYVRLTLPAGTGYAIEVSATTTAGKSCAGNATFDVVAAATQQVSVDLLCEGENDGNNTGDVVVNGHIVAGSGAACPDVAFLTAAPLQTSVGASIALNAGATSNADSVHVGWTATSGNLAASDAAVTTYTCTSPGTAVLTFHVTQGDNCTDQASVQVTCIGPSEGTSDAGAPVDSGAIALDSGATGDACEDLAHTCHPVDPGSGAIHDCHELGHSGDQATCSAQHQSCVQECGTAVCEQLAEACHELDPGSGPIHDCHLMGHAGDAQACFAGAAQCLALCVAPDSGASDAGTADSGAGDDGGATTPDSGANDGGTGEPDAGPTDRSK